MLKEVLQSICMPQSATIDATMRRISDAPLRGAPSGIVLITADDGRLEGVVTDGDIRRALVNSHSPASCVSEIMVRDPITVPVGASDDEMLRAMTAKVRASGRIRDVKVQHLIVIDGSGRVVDLLNLFDLVQRIDVGAKSIAVVGLGFVGMTLAAALAEAGFAVSGVDNKEEIIEAARAGRTVFHEPGIEPLLRHHVAEGNLRVSTDLEPADVYIIAVGTPLGPDGKPVMAMVADAARIIGGQLKRGDLVALRSTVPVGTSRDVVVPILDRESGLRCGVDFHLVFAPERMVEGDALREMRLLPQIIGGFDPRSAELGTRVFSRLAASVVKVDSLEAAEMAKLINNSYRDVSFGFANEFAMVCDRWNLDAVKIIEAANMGYPRNTLPVPSPGVGGFCLTKDPLIYARAALDRGLAPVAATVGRAINDQILEHVTNKILSFFGELGRKHSTPPKAFVLGFAFKGWPPTSDVRDSSTLYVVAALQRAGLDVHGFDPVATRGAVEAANVHWSDVASGFAGASAVILMNNHPSYKDLDLFTLLESMNRPALFFDGWHMFSRHEVEQVEGIEYRGLSGAL